MGKNSNKLAIAGCIVSICGVAAYSMAPVCLMHLLLTDLFAYLFTAVGQALSVVGIAISAVAHDRAFSTGSGAGWSLAGIVIGTAVMGMSLISTAVRFVA